MPGQGAGIGTIGWGIGCALEVARMLSAWLVLMLNSLFLTLRLAGNTGSFPKPLKAEEERKYLDLAQQGDLEARNVLVEHNLRLVAHIVKNG